MRIASLFALSLLGVAVVVTPCRGQDAIKGLQENATSIVARPASSEAATHADLQKEKAVSSADKFFSQFEPSEEPDITKELEPRDLIKQSDILCFQGIATLVPKHAVVHVPDRLKGRLALKPDVKIVTWLDFYMQNRGWITVLEVKLPEAEGTQAFDEDKLKWIESSSKIIVATLKGGPISVLPPSTESPDVAAK